MKKITAEEKNTSKAGSYFSNYTTIDAVKSVVKDKTEFRPYPCTKCEHSFKWPNNLKCHLLTHSGEKPFSCMYCDRKFAFKENLGRHEEMHREDRKYECPKCDKKFVTKSGLYQHQKLKNVENGEKLYDCSHPNCGKSFSLRSFLNLHVKQHAEIKPHACTTCSKSYVKKQRLLKHLLVHEKHEAKIKSLALSETNSTLQIKSTNNNQIQPNFSTDIEKQPPKYLCPQCPKQFWSRTRLDRHIDRRGHKQEQIANFQVNMDPQDEDNDDDENLHECPICQILQKM